MKTRLQLLHDSPFFEGIRNEHLMQLAEHARWESFRPGTPLVEEDADADTLYMLVVGEVGLSFEVPEDEPDDQLAGQREVLVRKIADPGRIIGWSAMVEPYHYRARATALVETQVLAFDRAWLEAFAAENPEFGIELMERILWVLGIRLRETRIRMIARRYNEESLAIRALLDQHAEQLSVTSPLHKLPFYLENRLTLSDAFRALEVLTVHGDELERNLASLCLEILENVRRELRLYRRLQAVYEHVAGAPATADPREVRIRCSEEFIQLYDHCDYTVGGMENLPDKPGHIVIMNHLDNHPDNILPNEFRLTLDTHFVSSVILYRKYGEPPIRVVRKSDPDEYGHQRYFDRLGYLYVYHHYVDGDEGDPSQVADERRRQFLESASSLLREGMNIVICPEGCNFDTEESPGPFKAGAFRLALHARPEPMIIPIAVANFEKKITRTRLAAVVGRPFRLSSRLKAPVSDADLYAFVNSYQAEFKELVAEAIRLTRKPAPVS